MLHGPAKGEAVKALAAREGLDLARCSAYSDSFNDLPLLSLVGDPCRDQPRRPAARPRPRAGLAGPRLPHRAQGGPVRAGRRRRRGRGERLGGRRRRRSAAVACVDSRPSGYSLRVAWATFGDRSVPRPDNFPTLGYWPVGARSQWPVRARPGGSDEVGESAISRRGSTPCAPPCWRSSPHPCPRPSAPPPSCADAAGRRSLRTAPRRGHRTASPRAAGPAGTTTPTWPPPPRTTRPSASG